MVCSMWLYFVAMWQDILSHVRIWKAVCNKNQQLHGPYGKLTSAPCKLTSAPCKLSHDIMWILALSPGCTKLGGLCPPRPPIGSSTHAFLVSRARPHPLQEGLVKSMHTSHVNCPGSWQKWFRPIRLQYVLTWPARTRTVTDTLAPTLSSTAVG